MGWSCAAAAGRTMDAWSEACRKSTGSSNQWSEGSDSFFFETSNREHADGAITGTVFKMLPGSNQCIKVSSVRIDGDGSIARAPKFLRDAARDTTRR